LPHPFRPRASLLLFSLAAAAPSVRAQQSEAKAAAVWHILRVQATWDSLWKHTEEFAHRFAGAGEGAINGGPGQNLHCHWDVSTSNSPAGQGRLIRSTKGSFSVCPSWDLGSGSAVEDERHSIDTALARADRPIARAARAALLRVLDSVAAIIPPDDFVAGQRIRFLVDQRELARAQDVSQSCGADNWWCDALRGYVRTARAEYSAAERAFSAALGAMPADERCRWTDHHDLLDEKGRATYARLTCAQRDSVNTRIWWLADPLLTVEGNQRKAEQYSRLVTIALKRAPLRDERQSWDRALGNDARETMVARYGWPSYLYWGGPMQDGGHTGWLATDRTPPNAPYTTYEYRGFRTHLIPSWNAIADVFRAEPGDWDLSPPDPREAPAPLPRPAAVTTLYGRGVERPAAPKFWWPEEHFESDVPIAQLHDGRHALLRRERGALLAVATELGTFRLGQNAGDSIRNITLFASQKPDSALRIATATGVVGSAFEIHGIIPSAPALAGVEFLPSPPRGTMAGRLRFGIVPPPPLSAMQPGETAISEPVLLRASGGNALPSAPESALPLMATSHEVTSRDKLGVYWETYGFSAADSVEVAIWIERYTNQGIARSFGIALGVAKDLNTPVTISWKEPDSGHNSHVFREGTVPVIGRSITLDISSLVAGDYTLEVAVRGRNRAALRSRVTFLVK
jgi:hypothetical protein